MGRSPCCDKNGLKKGPWTPEEDTKLIRYIETHGPHSWRTLPKNAGLQRCGKSCRLRWINYLRPDIKRGMFSFEEEETIVQLHSVLGNKWSTIATYLPGRTDNEIKNYWNTRIRKRLLKSGIDPVTHAPRLDILDLSSQVHLSNLFLQLQTLFNPQALTLALSLLSSNNNDLNTEISLPLEENLLVKSQNHASSPTFQPIDQFENFTGQVKEAHIDMNSINLCSKMVNMTASATTENQLPANYQPNYFPRASDQMKGELSDILAHPCKMGFSNSATTFMNESIDDLEIEKSRKTQIRFERDDSLEFDYFM